MNGRYWQILTYGFLHSTASSLPLHLIFNMYGFYLLGGYLVPLLGKWKFTFLYFTSLISGGLMVVLAAYLGVLVNGNSAFDGLITVTIGASGAVFGLMSMFGIFFPEMELLILFFAIRAKNAVWFSLILGAVMTYFGSAPISNTCHFGGALGGFAFYHFFVRGKQKERGNLIDIVVESVQKTEEKMIEVTPEETNKKHIQTVKSLNDIKKKEDYLKSYQVPSANICPPSTFNTEDSYCLNCEWLPNCLLRKTKDEA